METHCPICGCRDVAPQYRSSPARYCRCSDCGLVFLAERPAQSPPIVNDDLDRPPPRLLRWFLERRCALIRKLCALDNPRLLDVGCGSGRLLAMFRRYGQVAGVEISPQCRTYATQRLGLEVFGSLHDVPRDGRGYDVITFWHSLEHMDDPLGVLRAAGELLSADGCIFISVPNVASLQARLGRTRWAYHDYPNHVFEFSSPSLEGLLARAGLRVKARRRLSIEYGPFGALQTALNFLGGPHNFFYYATKRGWAYGELPPARRAGRRAINYLGLAAFTVPAILFSLCEPALGHGAVLQVAAVPATRQDANEP